MKTSILTVTFLFSFFLFHATAQSVEPPARHLEKIAFDLDHRSLILFGGAKIVDGELVEYRETYIFKNSEWTVHSATTPGGRNGCAMVYDHNQKCVFVLGGLSEANGLKIRRDMWKWDGKKWTLYDSLLPLKEPNAVFDPSTNRFLVFGDASDLTRLTYGSDQKFELWEYAVGTWKKLSTDGPSPAAPYGFAFDRNSNSACIVTWESGKCILWAWRDDRWTRTAFESGPPPRERYNLVYSAADKKLFLYGGMDVNDNFLGDLWSYKKGVWEEVKTTTQPEARGSAGLVDAGECLLLYGGVVKRGDKNLLSNEVWEFRNGHWKKLKGSVHN